jgi:hypothetical protein
LSAWRELLASDQKKYGHFGHIDVVVLPHCDEREIDRLEAALQIQKDIKADYTWDAQANMILAKQKRDGFTDKQIADLYGMKESEVRELKDMRNYAAEFLRSRGKDNHWSLVAGNEFAFRKLVVSRQKITNAGEQELFKQAAFTLVDSADEVGRRLYDAIPGIQEHLGIIKSKLQERFKAAPNSAPADAELDNLFSGVKEPAADAISMPLAAEIQKSENSEEARKIIVDVIESQRLLKTQSKAERYLLDSLAKAQAILASAIQEGLRPESKIEGVAEQVKALSAQIERINKWLSEHA